MAKSRILVVEDEGIIAHDIATQLANMGYEVVAVLGSGEEAVKKAGELQPDLVLMDIMLSGKMDGIEAAEIIRSRWGIPVVFLTAYADTDKLKRAKLIYPSGYVIKPFQANDLKVSIEISLHISTAEKAEQTAEKAMQESEERLRMIVEASLDAVIAVNAEGKIVLFNGAAEELFQYKEEEVLNQPVAILLREEASQKHQHRLEKYLKNGTGQCGHIGKRDEKIFRRKDGSQLEAEVSMSGGRSNGSRLVILTIRDITERKRTENEDAVLSEIRRVISSTLNIEEVYEQFAAEVKKLIHFDRLAVNLHGLHDETVQVAYVSGEEALGRRKGESFPLKNSISELLIKTKAVLLDYEKAVEERHHNFHNHDATTHAEEARSHLRIPLIYRNEVIGVLHFRSKTPNTYTERDLRVSERIGLHIAGAIGSAKLFSELMKTEDTLAQQNRTFAQVLHGLEAVVYVVDMKTYEVLFINSYGQKIWGDIKGKICWQTIQADQTGPCAFCTNSRLIGPDGNPTDGVVWEFQNTVNKRWYECRDKAIHWPDGRIVRMEIGTDITERKSMEVHLLRGQKLESLGVLAGGIAHDFNNLMGIVQGYIELAQMELPSDHVSNQRLLAAMRSMSQTRDLTSRLITFSRGGDPIMELFADVRETLRDAVLRTIKGTAVKATFNLTEKLWPVEMDELQVKQCFYNLTANAVEAMPDGGTLTIRAENYEMNAEQALPLKEGCYIKVTFTDEGPGIPEEYRQKVFDPYFTTKGMGSRNGLGLGLSVCHSVLKNHNGHIAVESTSEKGTSFALYLPAKIVPEKAKRIERRLPPGTGRVLIMDDDPDIRGIERAYLEQMGYEVTDVKDGQEAIDAYKKAMDSDSPIDLVMLDLTVHHGLGGLLVMERLLKFDPLIKAIIVSGSFNDPAVANYANYGFQGAVTKPFKRVEMKNLVEAILHG